MAVSTRRCTGFRPSRTSGSAREMITLMEYSRYDCSIFSLMSTFSTVPRFLSVIYLSAYRLDVQIFVADLVRILFDKPATRFHFVSHEFREDVIRLGGVLDVHPQ